MFWWVVAAVAVSTTAVLYASRPRRKRSISKPPSHAKARAALERGDKRSAAIFLADVFHPKHTHIMYGQTIRQYRIALDLLDELFAAAELEERPFDDGLREQLRDGESPLQMRALFEPIWSFLVGEIRKGTFGEPSASLSPAEEELILEDDTVTPPATARRNEALELAIDEDPDDEARFAVYADWLQEQGDPRGELAMLEGAAHDALLERHADHFLGRFGRDPYTALDFRHGFLHSAEVRSGEDVVLLRQMLAHPGSRFLRKLTINDLVGWDADVTHDFRPIVSELLAETVLTRTLAELEITPLDLQLSWCSLGDVSPLYTRHPRLRSLFLGAGEVELGEIRLPELERFTLYTGSISRESIGSITRATWPELRHLEIYFGDPAYGALAGVEDLEGLLARTDLLHLTSLGLRNADFTDEICEVIADAPMLPQLKALDLSLGTMSDAGARFLAARAEAFTHLERINVMGNYLSEEGIRLVSDICLDVDVTEQQPDGGARYVTVGE